MQRYKCGSVAGHNPLSTTPVVLTLANGQYVWFNRLNSEQLATTTDESIDITLIGINARPYRTATGQFPPYLHDGRATTIEEAIIEHGGEAATS